MFVNEALPDRLAPRRGDRPSFIPAGHRAQVERIRGALEQWERVRVDLVNYTRTGQPYWVDLDVSPVWDDARRLTHWVAVGRDITERKRDEERIQYLAFYDRSPSCPTGRCCWAGWSRRRARVHATAP